LHDAIYDSAVLAVDRPRIGVSHADSSRNSIETDGRIELDFGSEASFNLPYTVCAKEIRVTPKIRVLPSGNLCQSLDFCRGTSIAAECCQHRSTKEDAQCDKLATVVVAQTPLPLLLRFVVGL